MGKDERDSPSPISRPQSPLVLLVQAEWPARALLRADLQDRGCEVLATETVRQAIDICLEGGFRPDAVILDTVGLTPQAEEIERVEFLRGPAPLLLLSSNLPLSEPLTNLLPKMVLRRPFSVGNVSDVVLALTRSQW